MPVLQISQITVEMFVNENYVFEIFFHKIAFILKVSELIFILGRKKKAFRTVLYLMKEFDLNYCDYNACIIALTTRYEMRVILKIF